MRNRSAKVKLRSPIQSSSLANPKGRTELPKQRHHLTCIHACIPHPAMHPHHNSLILAAVGPILRPGLRMSPTRSTPTPGQISLPLGLIFTPNATGQSPPWRARRWGSDGTVRPGLRCGDGRGDAWNRCIEGCRRGGEKTSHTHAAG